MYETFSNVKHKEKQASLTKKKCKKKKNKGWETIPEAPITSDPNLFTKIEKYVTECALAPQRQEILESYFGKDVTTVILKFLPIFTENPRDEYVWETKIKKNKNNNMKNSNYKNQKNIYKNNVPFIHTL